VAFTADAENFASESGLVTSVAVESTIDLYLVSLGGRNFILRLIKLFPSFIIKSQPL